MYWYVPNASVVHVLDVSQAVCAVDVYGKGAVSGCAVTIPINLPLRRLLVLSIKKPFRISVD
jgi:hypothetical protein